MNLYIGVDGGGTKTHGILLSDGAVLAEHRMGSTNPNSVGTDAVRSILSTLFDTLLEIGTKKSNESLSKSNIRSVCLTMSGCNRIEEQTFFKELVDQYFNKSSSSSSPPSSPLPIVHAMNDAIGALASGTDGKLNGIVVISGTGMIAYGRNQLNADDNDNKDGGFALPSASLTGDASTRPPLEWFAGGNGVLMDDGSGFWIGLSVCRACFQSADGMGRSTPMLTATMNHLSMKQASDLIPFLYDGKMEWSKIASLAPIAFQFAAKSIDELKEEHKLSRRVANGKYIVIDPVAFDIIESAANYLIRAVRTVFHKLSFSSDASLSLVMSGSVAGNPLLFNMVYDGVKQFAPNIQMKLPTVSAAEGAALFARSLIKKE